MATPKLSDEEFLAFLEKHPDLRDRFASIVSAAENSEGNPKEADAAEERIIEDDATFGAGSDAGVGGAAGRSGGTRNSSTTSDASPG